MTIDDDPNGIENMLNSYKLPEKTKDNKSNMQDKNSSIHQVSTEQYTYNTLSLEKDSTKRIYNKVAIKFNKFIAIIKFLGYFMGIVSCIVLSQFDNFAMGFVICIIIFIVTWLSTWIFEGIAEGLQLLEDIKNK